MTDHPALQPVLRRADVTMLLQYIATSRDRSAAVADKLAKTNHPSTSVTLATATADGEARGLAHAHELVTSMWQAAVIATNAVNAGLVEDVDDDE